MSTHEKTSRRTWLGRCLDTVAALAVAPVALIASRRKAVIDPGPRIGSSSTTFTPFGRETTTYLGNGWWHIHYEPYSGSGCGSS